MNVRKKGIHFSFFSKPSVSTFFPPSSWAPGPFIGEVFLQVEVGQESPKDCLHMGLIIKSCLSIGRA